MIDDKKIEAAANKHIETEYARYNSGQVEEEMWELEVKAYRLDGWIYADELFDLIIKGGDSK